MREYSTKQAAGTQKIETLGGDYALKWDDETQMSVNAHAVPQRRRFTQLDIPGLELVEAGGGDCGNIFDEMKNQWGWSGFTAHSLKQTALISAASQLNLEERRQRIIAHGFQSRH